MSLPECRINILFSKLQIPCIKLDKCVLDIRYENKQYRVDYPQKKSFIMKFFKPFQKQKSSLIITILLPLDNKYKKIAKGILHIYKKYFYSNNFSFEKWVYLSLYKTQIEALVIDTDIIKTELHGGEIYVKAKLIDPLPKGLNLKINSNPEMNIILQSALKKINQEKESVSANKTERLRSVVEQSNAFLRKLKKGELSASFSIYGTADKNNIKDDLSDVSLSEIGDNPDYSSTLLNIDPIMVKGKTFYEKVGRLDLNKTFPDDLDKKREVYLTLHSEIKNISEQYIKTIKNLSKTNNDIKSTSKEYFNDYVKLKKKFKQERKKLNKQKIALQNEIAYNNQNNTRLKENKEKVLESFSEATKKYSSMGEMVDTDVNIMIDILNTLKFYNVNLSKGFSEKEEAKLNEILEGRNRLLTNEVNPPGNDSNGTDEDESDQIVTLIEEIVNNNFNAKLIPRIKIEQVDTFTYIFDGIKMTLEYTQDKTNLRCKDGTDFESWLRSTFQRKKLSKSS